MCANGDSGAATSTQKGTVILDAIAHDYMDIVYIKIDIPHKIARK